MKLFLKIFLKCFLMKKNFWKLFLKKFLLKIFFITLILCQQPSMSLLYPPPFPVCKGKRNKGGVSLIHLCLSCLRASLKIKDYPVYQSYEGINMKEGLIKIFWNLTRQGNLGYELVKLKLSLMDKDEVKLQLGAWLCLGVNFSVDLVVSILQVCFLARHARKGPCVNEVDLGLLHIHKEQTPSFAVDFCNEESRTIERASCFPSQAETDSNQRLTETNWYTWSFQIKQTLMAKDL